MEDRFIVELIWNRESRWVKSGPWHHNLADAIKYAHYLENMGDGASVKSTRIVDQDGVLYWIYGKIVSQLTAP